MQPHLLLPCFCTLLSLSCIAQPAFSDISTKAGIQALPGSRGIAIADFNRDGWEDMYVTFADRKNLLYKNLGNGAFAEVAQSAGVDANLNTYTAVWGDINNDGYPELYVGKHDAPDQLFLNNGDETFTDITLQAGIFQIGKPFSVNMADIDNDGFLDIYVSNFLYENIMFRNNGDNSFTNITYQAKALDNGKSMATIFFDYDLDGDQDLYLVHDGFQPNYLYQNDGKGVFLEVGQSAGADTKSFGMGVDAGDINNDGYPDLYITNLYENILLKNNGDGTFSDISVSAGVQDKGMGWGVNFLDYDNDGWLDIYVANEYAFSPYPNVLYRNLGNSTFEKTETGEAVCNKQSSYGTACLDYNLDGNLDIAVANKGTDEYLQLFLNVRQPSNWIGFKLTGGPSNRDAVGAKIRITDKFGGLHYRELSAGQSWQSQSSSVFHVGLGAADSIREMTVYWPSGNVQTVEPLAPNHYYRIEEGGLPQIGLLIGQPSALKDNKHLAHFDFQVFPNPALGGPVRLLLELPEPSPVHIDISDPAGRQILSKSLPRQEAGQFLLQLTSAELDPNTFSGIWTIRIAVESGVAMRQLLMLPNKN